MTQILSWSLLSTLSFGAFRFFYDSGQFTGGVPGPGDVPADLMTVMAANSFTSILLDINAFAVA